MEQFYTSKNKTFDRLLRLRQQPSWFNPRTQNTFTRIQELPASGHPCTGGNLCCALGEHLCQMFGVSKEFILPTLP